MLEANIASDYGIQNFQYLDWYHASGTHTTLSFKIQN